MDDELEQPRAHQVVEPDRSALDDDDPRPEALRRAASPVARHGRVEPAPRGVPRLVEQRTQVVGALGGERARALGDRRRRSPRTGRRSRRSTSGAEPRRRHRARRRAPRSPGARWATRSRTVQPSSTDGRSSASGGSCRSTSAPRPTRPRASARAAGGSGRRHGQSTTTAGATIGTATRRASRTGSSSHRCATEAQYRDGAGLGRTCAAVRRTGAGTSPRAPRAARRAARVN